ncbi:chemotaxis protein CheB [Caenimonas soli]|uniref:chemotaxis protein CheB n=1 Tax=Caenimonas soli TaxID=2735555 RepID=UPI0015539F3E|nr:chemotaxis protein CheB [Caenimonas soli]NPC58688.1 chemotaxis protein CheB [Caenimonas soli]
MALPHAIVIGASAGGVAALLELAAQLPADINAVVGVVLHVGTQHSILPELLSGRNGWRAVHPVDGERLAPGAVYVAPPDHHMLFTADAVRLSRGPRENHARPAVDPLFRSAALQWRERSIGVILTGDLDDGTAGLAAVKACGGTTIVQDPATAFEPAMPAHALSSVSVDHCLPLAEIAPALVLLAGSERKAAPVPPDPHVQREHAIFEGHHRMENLSALGTPSTLTCPDCSGGLWEMKDAGPLRYRCRNGHAFTALSLGDAQAGVAEHALWAGMRALHERELLLRRLATVAQATGDKAQAEIGRREADRVRAQAEQLGRLVGQG